MAHILIAGRTLSGKSTLGKLLCAAYRERGIETLVFDPVRDPEWRSSFQSDNREHFLQVYWASQCCAVFFDEGSISVGKYVPETEKTATLGRHRGHINHYICQRVTQIPPIVRDQCTELFLFSSSAKDCALLAEEFGHDELASGHLLTVGEYFHAYKMGACVRGNLFKKGAKNDSGNRINGRGDNGSRNDSRTVEENSGERRRQTACGEQEKQEYGECSECGEFE